jgi:hypothetical protein
VKASVLPSLRAVLPSRLLLSPVDLDVRYLDARSTTAGYYLGTQLSVPLADQSGQVDRLTELDNGEAQRTPDWGSRRFLETRLAAALEAETLTLDKALPNSPICHQSIFPLRCFS